MNLIHFHLYAVGPSLISFSPAFADINDNAKHNFALIGACESNSGDRRCALGPSDCKPSHIDGKKNVHGEKWHSAYRMNQLGYAPCTCEETRVSACFLGEAGLDSTGANVHFRCAPHSESCLLSKGETFGLINGIVPLEDDAQCGCSVLGVLEEHSFEEGKSASNQLQDSSGALEKPPPPLSQAATLYGACYKAADDNFCAFSPSDCQGADEGYSWVDPTSVSDMLGYECTCADTHVGGCVGGFMGFTCAVTSADCIWDIYYPPKKLKESHGYDCRLCKPIKHHIIHEDAIDKLASPTEDGHVLSTKNILAFGGIGMAIGIVVTLLGVFVCINHRFKREKPVRSESSKEFQQSQATMVEEYTGQTAVAVA